MKSKNVTRIDGPGCFQVALRRARFGHRDWVYWSDKDGAHADRATPETIKLTLLANGTKGRKWTLICSDGTPMMGFWWLGLNVIRQFQMGLR